MGMCGLPCAKAFVSGLCARLVRSAGVLGLCVELVRWICVPCRRMVHAHLQASASAPIDFVYTLKSLSSLLGDFFRKLWPGFLALDQNGDGTDGRDGRTEYSFTVLLGRRNTVLQYYLLFTIQFLKYQKTLFQVPYNTTQNTSKLSI